MSKHYFADKNFVNNNFVKFSEQTVLTEAQKRQARLNIGAGRDLGNLTWVEIRDIVDRGEAQGYFPVGYLFSVPHAFMGEAIFRVVGHDYDPLGTELGSGHNMVLEMTHAYCSPTTYYGIQFDAPEAFYFAENGLPAGTYHFTITTYGGWTAGTYQFTLTKAVPVGGQLSMSGYESTAITSLKVNVYASQTATSTQEQCAITAGSGGTDLGSWGSGGNNYIQRVSYGSNNYWQSAIRQFLNSANAKGAVWTPQTKFDRPPSWVNDANYPGFKRGFASDFLNAIKTQKIPCRTNSVFETTGYDGKAFTVNQLYNIEDMFFLLSRPEIYGTWDSASYKDGTILEFYAGLTDEQRKQFTLGSARNKWLRSPGPSYAHVERVVYSTSTGAVGGDYAVNSDAGCPACLI